MTKDFAILICSKKPIRTLEDYALTLAGIPPLKESAAKSIAEDTDINRLYHSYLSTLQQAVVVGDLKAVQNNFSNNAGEYICKYQDFIDWAASAGYMTYRLGLDASGQDIEAVAVNHGKKKPKLKKNVQRNEVAEAWLHTRERTRSGRHDKYTDTPRT